MGENNQSVIHCTRPPIPPFRHVDQTRQPLAKPFQHSSMVEKHEAVETNDSKLLLLYVPAVREKHTEKQTKRKEKNEPSLSHRIYTQYMEQSFLSHLEILPAGGLSTRLLPASKAHSMASNNKNFHPGYVLTLPSQHEDKNKNASQVMNAKKRKKSPAGKPRKQVVFVRV